MLPRVQTSPHNNKAARSASSHSQPANRSGRNEGHPLSQPQGDRVAGNVVPGWSFTLPLPMYSVCSENVQSHALEQSNSQQFRSTSSFEWVSTLMSIHQAYGSSSYKQASDSEQQCNKFHIENVYVYFIDMDRDSLQITRL